jgi:hypothetical protein
MSAATSGATDDASPTPPLPPADAVVAGVLGLLQARALGFEALLRLSSIEWSRAVSSACVECRTAPRLLLNPDFVARHCTTPRALAFLILHELSHVSFGHTGLFPRLTPRHNLAFDAVINASLLQGMRQRGMTVEGWDALVCATYAATESPWFLLRPPPGWPDTPDWTASAGGPAALRRIHRRLYDTSGATGPASASVLDAGDRVTYGEILRALGGTGEADGESGADGEGDGEAGTVLARLLGAHGATAAEEEALAGARDHAAAEALGAVLEGLTTGDHDTRGAGGAVSMARLDAQREERLVRALRTLLRATLTDSGRRREWRWTTQPALSVDPSRDRRAAVRRHAARALGAPAPRLYHDMVATRRAVPAGDAVVYLDVSGSMGEWIGRLHAALVPLRRLLAPALYAFSTEVHALRHADLLAGRLPTTGGTDIGPVLQHLLQHRGPPPSRVLLLTDGAVGIPDARAVRTLAERGTALHVGLVQRNGGAPRLPWAASVTGLQGG